MDGPDEPIEQIAFLARSPTRVRLINRLRTAAPASRRELSDQIEVSRSTVSRALSALEERNWIRDEGGEYRLTALGDVVAAEFGSLVDTLSHAERLAPFLRWFPHDEYDLDLTALTDATITTKTPTNPYAASQAKFEVFSGATNARLMLRSLNVESARKAQDRILSGTLSLEILVTPSVAATLETGEYRRLALEALDTEDFRVLVADGPLPFHLGLANESYVQIGVDDDQGFPRALLETTAQPVRRWAEAVYSEKRTGAREKPRSEF